MRAIIYHCTDPDAFNAIVAENADRWRQHPYQYRRVAELEVYTLQEVFRLSRHVEHDWTTDKHVIWCAGDGKSIRSTSIGDVIVMASDKDRQLHAYLVKSFGFEDLGLFAIDGYIAQGWHLINETSFIVDLLNDICTLNVVVILHDPLRFWKEESCSLLLHASHGYIHYVRSPALIPANPEHFYLKQVIERIDCRPPDLKKFLLDTFFKLEKEGE